MNKNWKVKYTANVFTGISARPNPSLYFWRDWKYFETKEDALNHINKSLPNRGIGSQICTAYLFERVGWCRWKYIDRYQRKTTFRYEDGEQVAYPINGEIELVSVPWKIPKGKVVTF